MQTLYMIAGALLVAAPAGILGAPLWVRVALAFTGAMAGYYLERRMSREG